MNYEIYYLCLANKIHYGHNAASSFDELYNGELRKNLFENTRVSQKKAQRCFHIGLGSRELSPHNILSGGWNIP